MSYALTFESFPSLVEARILVSDGYCDCARARAFCAPSFVFSVEGQVGFRHALRHLSSCQKRDCRTLRRRVINSMHGKLSWLMHEDCLLGCVHIQPALYGTRRIILKRNEWPSIATHLARCPKESCAQLRRSVLLRIRDELRSS